MVSLFVEVKEFGVPDTVKSMLWCGEDICVGIRREYMILNATNGALSEVFPSGRIAPPLVVSLLSGEFLLGKVSYQDTLRYGPFGLLIHSYKQLFAAMFAISFIATMLLL
ncbi:unnamed protein product [Fraxinus pennsylvanica]|uniref:Uncharacterized protein n=1 Tax=Fraxinus pennsylvanica TaxID=56036 RepID=A0AAD2DTF6_9LAMI|nr:unnamed protein product [Fraxinus pennsylvanica]